jgi:hypothetical protein
VEPESSGSKLPGLKPITKIITSELPQFCKSALKHATILTSSTIQAPSSFSVPYRRCVCEVSGGRWIATLLLA